MTLLHTHVEEGAGFFDEVILHGITETLRLIPFLFITYLLMEFIEHKGSDKAERFMRRAGRFGPFVGGLLGAVPQCGFSAAASGLYSGGVISVGTLIAVFLSTSDEMLPILLSGEVAIHTALFILLYKAVAAIAVGLLVDLGLHLAGKDKRNIDIDELCEIDNCHCEKGIFYSALHHTLTITLFVFAVTVALGALVFFVGEETIGNALDGIPVLSHLLAALVGLIPNCAVSVALAKLATEGIISAGVMLSGLFSGAGVGLLVMLRTSRDKRAVLFTVLILVISGVLLGLLGELLFTVV